MFKILNQVFFFHIKNSIFSQKTSSASVVVLKNVHIQIDLKNLKLTKKCFFL